MAETKRMTAEQVVSYLLEEDGLDFLRESLIWVVQQLMEAEVSELVGAARGERLPCWKQSLTRMKKTRKTRRRHANSPRPEQPTIKPTSYTTSRDWSVPLRRQLEVAREG